MEVVNEHFFNEFAVRVDADARQLVRDLAERKILAGISLGRLFPNGEGRENGLLIAVTETNTEEDIEALATALGEALA